MIYLDNAATSFPKPACVKQAMDHALDNFANPGRSGHALAVDGAMAIYRCRESLAGLFHTEDPLRYIFCLNCTDALNIAIRGMVRPGSRVVTTALEHNSVLRPLHWQNLAHNVEVCHVQPRKDGYIDPADVEKALTKDTSLMILCHASNLTGALQDAQAIHDICKYAHVPMLLDMAQTAGSIDIDLSQLDIDLAAFPGHKGLLGPQGTGILYIKEGCAPLPMRQGGTGSQSSSLVHPNEMPDRYESGTAATPAIAGLSAAVEYTKEHLQDFEQKENRLYKQLWEGLAKLDGIKLYSPPPDKPHVGVVTFNVLDFDSGEFADYLWNDHRIACRAGLHCAPLAHLFLGTEKQGAIRFSLGCSNTPEEIDEACQAVRKGLAVLQGQ